MKYLKPLILKEKYYIHIEEEIQRILDVLIYKRLLRELATRMAEFTNSSNALLEAIRMGFVWYEDGYFRGKFSAVISREIMRTGAVFDGRAHAWKIAPDLVPSDIKFTQATADARFRAMRDKLISMLDSIDVANVTLASQMEKSYFRTLGEMESDLQRTMPTEPIKPSDAPATARSRIAIEAKLTDAQKNLIAQQWSDNAELYIKGWTQNNILKLRSELVQPHVLAGGRAQAMVKTIQDNYGVSQRKAKFLARQETALLMSSFQESRYADMGVQEYKWSDSHDKRVRHDHHELNGKIFRFDQPPISNKKTGARNNPGQDFNCRCIAIPVIW